MYVFVYVCVFVCVYVCFVTDFVCFFIVTKRKVRFVTVVLIPFIQK